MKKWTLLGLLLAFVTFAWGCQQEEKKAAQGSGQEKKVQEVKPAAPAMAPDWAQQKEEFEKKAQAALDELSKKTAEMKDKIAATGGEAKEKLTAKYQELTDKEGGLRKKLDELKSATADTWEKTKAEVEAGIEYLKNTLKKATSEEKQ